MDAENRRQKPHIPGAENRIPEQIVDLQMELDDFELARDRSVKNPSALTQKQDSDQQRRQYYDLFDFAPDGYLLTDASGRVWEANLAASALLNVPQDRLPGKSLLDFIPGAGRRSFRARLARLEEVNKVSDWEI